MAQEAILGFLSQGNCVIDLLQSLLRPAIAREQLCACQCGVPMWIQQTIARDSDTSVNLFQQRRTLIRFPLRQAYQRKGIEHGASIVPSRRQNGDSALQAGNSFIELSYRIKHETEVAQARSFARRPT